MSYQPRRDIRRGPFDGSFECQLPAEVRTELEEIFRPQTYRPAPSAPPVYPRPPVVTSPPLAAKPSSTAPWIIALLGVIVLAAVVSNSNRSPAPSTNGIVPQLQRAIAPARVPEIGAQQMTTMPDGSQVPTTFKGYLSDVSQLPHHGAQLGDMWGVGRNWWVLTAPLDSAKVGWVDPPATGELEVRRALPVGQRPSTPRTVSRSEGGDGAVASRLTG